MAQLEERWHINPGGRWLKSCLCSLQTMYLWNLVSFPLLFIWLYDIKSRILFKWSPDCRFPRLYHNMGVWSLAMRHAVVQWLLTSAPPPPPKQSYWHNRENAKIGPNGSVGRPLAHYSVGCRFRSSSSKYFFVTQNMYTNMYTHVISMTITDYSSIRIWELNGSCYWPTNIIINRNQFHRVVQSHFWLTKVKTRSFAWWRG